MPAAALVPAAIGAGSSIFGGIMGSRASNKAAQQQMAASQQAQDFISNLLKQYNPQIGTAAQQAADLSTQAGTGAVENIRDTLAQNRTDVQGGLTQANALLDPYAQAGAGAVSTLSSLMAPGGDLNRQFTFQDIQTLDPGYQFRMDQASKALQSSAAARGGALSGGTLSALSNLNQNLASAEAQNAFNRLEQQQQGRFGRLQSMIGTGLAAGGQQAANVMGANQFLANQGLAGAQNIGQWMIQPAQYAGTALMGGAEAQAQNAINAGNSIANLMTGAGNAQAAGTMGGANAWSGALGGVANAAGNVGRYYQDRDLLKQLRLGNPAVKTG